jgi:DNA-binding protein H-NS
MTNYTEMMQKAKDLMAQAEQIRKEEQAKVINEIKSTMQQYGISVTDLGSGSKGHGKSEKATPKYRGPNGELWSGGRGRKPQWILDQIKAGKNVMDFLI